MKLLFATTHAGKVAELEELLAGELEVVSLKDFPGLPPVKEVGVTFEENARLKAVAYSQATGLAALADDSGLCVDALGGRPGLYSARYGDSDSKRVAKLLSELHDVPEPARRAHFTCALCLAWPTGRYLITVASCEGRIATEPSGQQGFGYDPIFYLPKVGKTLAELTRAEKAMVSHRGEAFRKMVPHLKALLADDALPASRR